MGYAENMRILSNINCGLASTVGYIQARNNGASPLLATAGFVGNIGNGFARNEIAYEMQKHGNPIGNTINLYAGYGNPVSNTIGTIGLMRACNPWVFWNTPCCYARPMMLPPCGSYSYSYSHTVSYRC